MNLMIIMLLNLVFSGITLASIKYSSGQDGRITVDVLKHEANDSICYDINLQIKNAPEKEMSVTNWNAAWIDAKGKYHLLFLQSKSPIVSTLNPHPEVKTFQVCSPRSSLEGIKKLVLFPRELSTGQFKTLVLNL
jgi:hypothetical protein